MDDPIQLLGALRSDAVRDSRMNHPDAGCLSTVDELGYPNSRFVELKDVDERGLVFCTHLESAKAAEIARQPRVGLALWWDDLGVQVRIKGVCVRISGQEADAHWLGRTRDAQVSSVAFAQGRPMGGADELARLHDEVVRRLSGREIPRPSHWGGFRLRPSSIEFQEFKQSRLHVRTLYVRQALTWSKTLLQP